MVTFWPMEHCVDLKGEIYIFLSLIPAAWNIVRSDGWNFSSYP